ncbi:9526_t:CDS:2 [Ambispora leptoticha]|uniref:9526_t:CDS:1 n=1 Tax=Ambispora leptoticha TaxID=144679 RepID=A0A9N9GHZ7_9GLOM|nr:9526_t:CDS:2 [Ambispora leptoticha]
MLKSVNGGITTQSGDETSALTITSENVPTTSYANLHAPSTWPSTQPYNGIKDHTFYTVFTFVYVFLTLCFISSSYVIYRTYMKWKYNDYESLPMSLRLPFYAAAIDLFLTIVFLINVSYAARYAVQWYSPICEMLGALSVWSGCLNVHFFFVITILTYLRVCRKVQFDYGKYDYKFFLIIVLWASLPELPALNGGYGAQRWWCGTKGASRLIAITSFANLALGLCLTAFAYVRILILLANHRPQLDDPSNIERRITQVIVRYILLFFLQWLPAGAYSITQMNGDEAAWTYIVWILGQTFNGIANAIQYILIEGLSHKITLSSNSSNSSNNTILVTKKCIEI